MGKLFVTKLTLFATANDCFETTNFQSRATAHGRSETVAKTIFSKTKYLIPIVSGQPSAIYSHRSVRTQNKPEQLNPLA